MSLVAEDELVFCVADGPKTEPSSVLESTGTLEDEAFPNINADAEPSAMSDEALIGTVRAIGTRWKTFNHYFQETAPYVLELHSRFAKQGRRMPIEGNPSWAEFVRETFGVSDRYLRKLIKLWTTPETESEDDQSPLEPMVEQTEIQSGDGDDSADDCGEIADANPEDDIDETTEIESGDYMTLYDRVESGLDELLDDVFKKLDAITFARTLERFTLKIAERYDHPVSVVITVQQD